MGCVIGWAAFCTFFYDFDLFGISCAQHPLFFAGQLFVMLCVCRYINFCLFVSSWQIKYGVFVIVEVQNSYSDFSENLEVFR